MSPNRGYTYRKTVKGFSVWTLSKLSNTPDKWVANVDTQTQALTKIRQLRKADGHTAFLASVRSSRVTA